MNDFAKVNGVYEKVSGVAGTAYILFLAAG